MMKPRFFRMTIAFLIVVFVLSIFVGVSYASKSAEELLQTPGLNSAQRAAIAEAIAKSKPESILPTSLKGVLEWQEMGDAFSTTIKNICQTLNVEVNTFLKSDVGLLTASIIVYKMIGKDILRIVLYTGIWFGVTFFMMMSIKFLHMKKLVPGTMQNPNNKEVTINTTVEVDRFGWEDDVTRNISLCLHIIAWFVFSCVIAYNVI